MTTIYTEDGSTVTRRYRTAPVWHWVDDGSGSKGQWVPTTTALGYYPLVEVDRPADTDTTTHDYSVVRDGVTFVEVWTERPKTDDELTVDAPNPVDVLVEQAVAAQNAAPQPWEAGRRYLPGAVVLDGVDGDRYRNDLGTVNVWPLTERHARWTNLDYVAPIEPQPWVPWSGFNEDLHQIGDFVTHNGQTWEATVGNNHWEPGTFGWVVV